MPPSQLKKLKASLREQGILGPQKSKKQKKQSAQNDASVEKRIQRNIALGGIREMFNPFEYKTSARGPKFDITNSKAINGDISKSVKTRPGITKGLGEETRRKTLLVELQRRHRVGGIIDRRFGENDPTMTPEDKMLERFTQEKQRRHNNSSIFDLEDEGAGELTHMGQSLSLDGPTLADDFDSYGLELSDAEDHLTENAGTSRKRRRVSKIEEIEGNDGSIDGQPERKKTKQEAMKEVIAKSKFYKYERQAAKDDDDDLREELDGEIGEIHALLRQTTPHPAATSSHEFSRMNPERVALLNSAGKNRLDKEYDMRLRQLAQDKKSKPTERTKTEEEKFVEESSRLKELEARRLLRMQGQPEDDEGGEGASSDHAGDAQSEASEDFGLGTGIGEQISYAELGVEDEDEFVIDENIVIASGSDIESSGEDELFQSANSIIYSQEEDSLDGSVMEDGTNPPGFLTGANRLVQELEVPISNGINGDLPYTFTCPETHDEFLKVVRGIMDQDLPEVVRRIRALYHPKLKSENKGKLANFTVALVDHVSFLANHKPSPQFGVLENLIRHIHSLAKSFPVETGNVFRKHLEDLSKYRALMPTSGDLVLATAVGTIFPTSDHFHQVVTPTMLGIARYIGQKIPHKLCEYSTGIYMAALALRYQKVSKRYIPEVIGFLLNTLCAFMPTKPPKISGNFAYHDSKLCRLDDVHTASSRKLNFLDTLDQRLDQQEEIALKLALMETSIKLLESAANIWTGKLACIEIFEPTLILLKKIGSNECSVKLPPSTNNAVSKVSQKLQRLLTHARMARRPLELHHHRPLAIKSSIPKFEESFNPDKHYDPDRERAEASKLRAEYKRERKGAMRELRKDASFVARESLREKKEKDAAYEKKYKRLVAEIQGEEGREAKAYEREKEWRKQGRK